MAGMGQNCANWHHNRTFRHKLNSRRHNCDVLAVLAVSFLVLWTPALGATVAQDYNAWLTHMLANYPTFTQILMQHQLTTYINKHISRGGTVTLMAPTDAAMAAYLKKKPCPRGTTVSDHRVLTDHILNGRLLYKTFLAKPKGTQYATFGPDKFSKLSSNPPWMGLVQGTKTLAYARLTKPQSMANSRIAVHGINRVIYTCRK